MRCISINFVTAPTIRLSVAPLFVHKAIIVVSLVFYLITFTSVAGGIPQLTVRIARGAATTIVAPFSLLLSLRLAETLR